MTIYSKLFIGATACEGEGLTVSQAGQNAITEAEKLVSFKPNAKVSIMFWDDKGDNWAETWTVNFTDA